MHLDTYIIMIMYRITHRKCSLLFCSSHPSLHASYFLYFYTYVAHRPIVTESEWINRHTWYIFYYWCWYGSRHMFADLLHYSSSLNLSPWWPSSHLWNINHRLDVIHTSQSDMKRHMSVVFPNIDKWWFHLQWNHPMFISGCCSMDVFL